jgi:membrane associated rhomboid family serine protease
MHAVTCLQAGSSGALYGLMAVLVIELFQSWQILAHPWREFFKQFVVITVSLFIGTLPWIDNWAHFGMYGN